MYGDQLREFVCGYWDLKGELKVKPHLISADVKQPTCGIIRSCCKS